MKHLSAAERNLLLLIVVLLGVSGIARWGSAGSETSFQTEAEVAQVGDLRAAVDEERGRAEVRSRPLVPGEQIALDEASTDELQRLPGVGSVTAERIVAWRDGRGGIAAVEELVEVAGIGEATLARLAPHLTIERPASVSSGTRTSRVDVNRASVEDLQSLPGIGPAIAGRIVESRVMEGPFRDLSDLTRVPGIGVRTATRLEGRVEFGAR